MRTMNGLNVRVWYIRYSHSCTGDVVVVNATRFRVDYYGDGGNDDDDDNDGNNNKFDKQYELRRC